MKLLCLISKYTCLGHPFLLFYWILLGGKKSAFGLHVTVGVCLYLKGIEEDEDIGHDDRERYQHATQPGQTQDRKQHQNCLHCTSALQHIKWKKIKIKTKHKTFILSIRSTAQKLAGLFWNMQSHWFPKCIQVWLPIGFNSEFKSTWVELGMFHLRCQCFLAVKDPRRMPALPSQTNPGQIFYIPRKAMIERFFLWILWVFQI